MIGERVRHARKAAGLTLDELAQRLEAVGEKITKAGISKYELGKSTPKASFLTALGRVLELPSQYFLQTPQTNITWRLFRKKSKLSLSKQESIKAQVRDIVESQIWLEDALNLRLTAKLPPREIATSFEDAERLANTARHYWCLGQLPVENLTSLLESHGFIVVPIPDLEVNFDGLSGWVNGCNSVAARPLIVVNTAVPSDRVRYNLLHELGHLLIGDQSIPEKDEEKYAHRFAAAFLAPEEVVYRELGRRRRNLLLDELSILKRKYGFSMQAWIRRASDLGIISKTHYQALFREFSRRGWRKKEPVSYEGYEVPSRYQQLFLRARAEDIITEGRTHLVLPKDILLPAPISKARTLLEMPPNIRHTFLERIANEAASLYYENNIPGFEGADDFHEYTDKG